MGTREGRSLGSTGAVGVVGRGNRRRPHPGSLPNSSPAAPVKRTSLETTYLGPDILHWNLWWPLRHPSGPVPLQKDRTTQERRREITTPDTLSDPETPVGHRGRNGAPAPAEQLLGSRNRHSTPVLHVETPTTSPCLLRADLLWEGWSPWGRNE